MATLHIGFDDTDSPRGGCTTYIAAILVEKFKNMGFSFSDYPNLIRLNPNVPWKTRGNGALCLRLICKKNDLKQIKETVIDTIENYSDLNYEGTNPGIVLLYNKIPKEVKEFAKKTEQSIVTIDSAFQLSEKFNAEVVKIKKGRGIIGALAAIGEDLSGDHTFEIISYRNPKKREKNRLIRPCSIKKMDNKSQLTYNNIDPKTDRILITPRGPDPILCGIRGETPKAVKQAYEMLKIDESVERWMIFRTNQGTDAHLRKISKIKEIKPYNPFVTQALVSKSPQVIQGGHVIFSVKDETGELDCAAYKPTVILSNISRELLVGDFVKISGGIHSKSAKHELTVNLEKIKILNLVPKITFVNPKCPECSKRLKSMGKDQGFRCEKCGFRSSKLKKLKIKHLRKITKGLYITSPRSQRHLTKPHSRYGKEKNGPPKKMIEKWHYP